MNINALPAPIAASIAGSDRAAATHLAVTSKSENSASNPNVGEPVDSIDKGNASEDKEADGRQTLDTFERQRRDADSQQVKPQTSLDKSDSAPSEVMIAGRLDFKA